MRERADAEGVRRLATELGRSVPPGTKMYLTGGETAVLEGWRESTVDLYAAVESEMFRFPGSIQRSSGFGRVADYLNSSGSSAVLWAPPPEPQHQPFDGDPEQAEQEQRQGDEGDDAEAGGEAEDERGEERRRNHVDQQGTAGTGAGGHLSPFTYTAKKSRSSGSR